MKDYGIIKQNSRFKRLYIKGKSVVMPTCVLYIRKIQSNEVFVGLTVSKKIGKAHLRNRSKRLLRVAARECVREGLCGCEMVLAARSKTPYVKSDRVVSELISALKQIGYIE